MTALPIMPDQPIRPVQPDADAGSANAASAFEPEFDSTPDPTPAFDLRDRRGRLVRFVAAVGIGLAVTALGMYGIMAVSVAPNTDPVGASTPALLAIAMFVVVSAFTLKLFTAIARSRRGDR